MVRVVRRAGVVVCLFLALSSMATAQPAASRVLFRVFLSDGRVLSSYGEWARLDDRVIFSMPTQLSREPVELQLVTIPSQRVDWPRIFFSCPDIHSVFTLHQQVFHRGR